MYEILFLVVVGALIGWITNMLAIKMLFRPIKAIKIPGLNITIQGLIPKRRNEIAKSIGEVVEGELVSLDEILGKLVTEENKNRAIEIIREKLLKVVDYKIPSIIPYSIKSKIIDYFDEQINKDARAILDSTVESVVAESVHNIRVGEMVESKINEFELEKIEEIILSVTSRELRYIELLGGLLGGIIGLIQGIVIRII
jgi:uncharacterized membrane protein YheB (UPF0754 family)